MRSWSGFTLHRRRASGSPARRRGLAAALLVTALAAPAGAAAETVPVDVELALAVDVSRSVDEEEAQLQREGYIAAFRHPDVVAAIRRGPRGRIAVSYYEWGGYGDTHLVVDWTLVEDKASAAAFADELAASTPMMGGRTSVSGAIAYGAALFDRNRFESRRRVIDISGDGANNSGGPVTAARDRAVEQRITINGLPILNTRESPGGWRQIDALDLYYRDCVIGGPGAFYIAARDFGDFARAVLRKLVLEIAGDRAPARAGTRRGGASAPMLVPAAAEERRSPPCDVGEHQRRRRWLGDDIDLQPRP